MYVKAGKFQISMIRLLENKQEARLVSIADEKQKKVVVPLNLICDAIEMADDEWKQYLDIEKMEVVSLPESPFAGEYDEDETVTDVEDLDDSKNLIWEEISTEHIVQDQWIDFRRSAYRFPDGSVYEPFYSYSRRDYVVIVASDASGKYLCVRQFRQGIKEVTTEFPAGGIERTDGKEYGVGRGSSASESALEAAKRELLEETGYVSKDWTHLLTVPANATITDNYVYIFMAENCCKSGGQNLDETEFLNIRKYSADQIEEMIDEGNFQQAVHIMAWLLMQKRKMEVL